MKTRQYLCIDLKSFYASVECRERGLDPMTARLVVANPARTERTICLAVSPALKSLGIPGRCRVFEIPKGIEYITAPPRMQLYIDYAAEIYAVYLSYVAKEDIHVYSIDEAFLDVTDYLSLYGMTARELGRGIMERVLEQTGIPAACGIGTNLYLAKIALDITAKHAPERIGELDEETYCRTLWNHRPLTDFWRVGPGTAKRLERIGIFTMGELARAEERQLYRLFGIDAELLFDHAWGREPVTMEDIKNYRPQANSMSSGQVLPRDYDFAGALLLVKEMADQLCLDLAGQKLVTDSVTLQVGYNHRFHRKPAHGTVSLTAPTGSARVLIAQTAELYRRIADRYTPVRRLVLTFNRVTDEICCQYDLFTSPEELEKERRLQAAVLKIRGKYGKNAILRGMNFLEGATARERNLQIGGHRSGV